MERFTVKELDQGEACCVAVEGTPLRIELDQPADYQHAWRVAHFLNENVRQIVAEPR